jgi:mannitol-1-phosphate/altronate dehydrogenase
VFLTTTIQQVLARSSDAHILAFILASWSRVLEGSDDAGNSFEVTEPRLDENSRRLLISGEPREALMVEPLAASGAAEHTEFIASFDHYRKALEKSGARAVLKAVLGATAG